MASLPVPSRPLLREIRNRWTLALPLAAALGVLITHFALQVGSGIVLIRYPFGIDYGEGIVWQQMRNIMHGAGYGPLGVYPAIVYHYPPVFHVTAGMAARLFGTDELATGRAVSWIAGLGTAAIVGRLAD